MPTLEAGPWLPDVPALRSAGCPAVFNLFLGSGGNYVPLRGLAPALNDFNYTYPALTETVFGGAHMQSPTAPFQSIFAQTQHHFFIAFTGREGWAQIDGVGETYDALNGRASSVNAGFDPMARFTQFGNAVYITRDGQFDMHQFNDTPAVGGGPTDSSISVMINSSTDGAGGKSLGTGPLGYYPAVSVVVKSFLVIGCLWNTGNRMAWSGVNQPTFWPLPGTNLAQQVQSDYEDLPGSLGFITNIIPNLLYADAVIVCSGGIWRMIYTGPPDIFDFYPVASGRGTSFRNSIVALNGLIYYAATDGFYTFNGLQGQSIGDGKVDLWFRNACDSSRPWTIVGSADLRTKCILWVFIAQGSNGLSPQRVIIFHTVTGKWSVGLFTGSVIFPSVNSFGTSQDTSLDFYPAPIADVDVWAFDGSNVLSNFSGAPMGSTLQTAEVQLLGELKGRVRSIRPLIDGYSGTPDEGEETADPTATTGSSITVTLNTRDRLDVAPSSLTVPINARGVAPFRTKARYVSATINTPKGANFTSIVGADLEIEQAGRR